MIRFLQDTFVRHVEDQSLLWRPRTGACVIIDGAEPFLRHIGWTERSEEEMVAGVATDFGMRSEEIADDFQEFVAPLIEDGFLTTEVSECSEESSHIGAGRPPSLRQESFDADGNVHDDSWSPLGDFFRDHNIPTELHIDLTAACTERCVHCYLPDYPNKHLPFALVEKALREFRNMQGLTVHLTGGECMLHPDFEQVCSLCKELNLNFIILSNLTICDEKRIVFLSKVQPQYINVSLYSMDEKEHDAITQLPGSWRRTMDAILSCETAGVHVRLAVPLLKENKYALRGLTEFARGHRMHLIPSIDIVPQSDHDCSNLAHACSAMELREVLMSNHEIFGGSWEATRCIDPDDKVCNIGASRLYLNAFGNYYPCDSMHGYVLGNVATDSLGSIWHGEKLTALRQLANKDFPQCLACTNRPVCKVCPAFNFNATGDIFKTTQSKCAVAAVVREVYGDKKPC